MAHRGALDVKPSSLAQGEVVDLHHHAVDLVGEVVAVLLPVQAVRVDLVERRRRRVISGFTGKPERRAGTRASRGGVASVGTAHDLAELVAPERQLAAWR